MSKAAPSWAINNSGRPVLSRSCQVANVKIFLQRGTPPEPGNSGTAHTLQPALAQADVVGANASRPSVALCTPGLPLDPELLCLQGLSISIVRLTSRLLSKDGCQTWKIRGVTESIHAALNEPERPPRRGWRITRNVKEFCQRKDLPHWQAYLFQLLPVAPTNHSGSPKPRLSQGFQVLWLKLCSLLWPHALFQH